jgi:hypothetical protein
MQLLTKAVYLGESNALPANIPIDPMLTNALESIPDPVITHVRYNTQRIRERMILKHRKHHNIVTFAIRDIVAVKLPRDTRTSADNKRIFGKVLIRPHSAYRDWFNRD